MIRNSTRKVSKGHELIKPDVIDNVSARRLFMARQGLTRPVREKLNSGSLLSLIQGLGFVQVDSINTVSRAHHMILQARNQTYRPKMLANLLEKDRSLFEHWTHDASVIPTEFYPYWQHRFARERVSLVEKWRKWHRKGFEEALDNVLAHVDRNGRTMARDLDQKAKQAKSRQSGGWWDWNPEKTALEFHWRTGALSICRREGFQKVYDLTTRVIPEHHRQHIPDEASFIDWACRSALDRLGVATSGELAAFWDLITPKEAATWSEGALKSGAIREVSVACWDGSKPRKSFAYPDLKATLRDLPEPPKRVRVLSPFDPLIRDRKRCQRLFGFDYRIEVFVPEPKRKYGYYVFPLLRGDRLIGRIDMKHIREKDALVVSGLWMEPGVRLSKACRQALDAELDRQRRFVGAAEVIFPEAAVR